VLLQLDIDRVAVVDVHEMQGCSALPDHLKVSGIVGVVKAVERAVINAEAVTPEMKSPLLRLSARVAGWDASRCLA
jgi:hypothetical protein